MPNTKSAKKRLRQSNERRARNRAIKSVVRLQIRKVTDALETGDVDAAAAEFPAACSQLDKAGARGTIHVNKAARQKSRLSAKIKAAKG